MAQKHRYTAELLPVSALGIAAILAGRQLGLGVSGKLNAERVKKLVFLCVGITGVLTLAQQLA